MLFGFKVRVLLLLAYGGNMASFALDGVSMGMLGRSAGLSVGLSFGSKYAPF